MTFDILQSSTQSALVFLLVQSSDHITGKTGAVPGVSLSKNGASFVLCSGTIAELGSGWYKVGGNATDTNTLGPLALHATATSCDPTDFIIANIVSFNPQDAVHLGLSSLPNTAVTTNASLLTSGTGTDQLSVTTGRVDLGKTLGATSTGAAGYIGIDWAQINAPTTAVALTKTTISTSQIISQVINSVGSVAGNVTGTISTSQVISQVTGSVGSVAGNVTGTISTSQVISQVTGSVGSVAGNVTGTISTSQVISSVTGSVGSVVGAVGSVTGAVGSVTGNVGGTISTSQVISQVTGSVGSVAGNVTGTISTSQVISSVTGSVGSVTNAVTVGTINASAAKYKKNAALNNFGFTMQNSTTGGDQTGLTVASKFALDGGSFSSTSNSVTEIGLGWYNISLLAVEMNATFVKLQFTAPSAVTRDIEVTTQP